MNRWKLREMIQQKQRQAEYYDCMAWQLPDLQQNQLVCVHLDPAVSLAESHGHWDTHRQKPQSLPDQLGSPVHEEQKVHHPSSSRPRQYRTNHARVTSDTTCTAKGKVQCCHLGHHKCTQLYPGFPYHGSDDEFNCLGD